VRLQGFEPPPPKPARALTNQLTLWLLARHNLIAQHQAGITYFEDIAAIL